MGLFGDIWKGITGVPRAVGALLGAGDSDFGDFRGAAGALGDTLGLAAPILGATGVGAPAALGLGAIGGVLQKADDEGAKFEDFVGSGLKNAAIGGAGHLAGGVAGKLGGAAGGTGQATAYRVGETLSGEAAKRGGLAGVGKVLGGAGRYLGENPEVLMAGLGTAADVYGAGQQGEAQDRQYQFMVEQAKLQEEERARMREERERQRRQDQIGMLLQGIQGFRSQRY